MKIISKQYYEYLNYKNFVNDMWGDWKGSFLYNNKMIKHIRYPNYDIHLTFEQFLKDKERINKIIREKNDK